MRHFKSFLFVFFIGLTQVLTAQVDGKNTVVTDRVNEEFDRAPLNSIEKAAEKAMAEGDYYAAMQYYKRVVRFDSSNVKAWRGIGDAAMHFAAYEEAENAFQHLININQIGSDAAPILKLAELKYRRYNFVEAKLIYERLLAEKPAGVSQEALAEAQKQLINCQWAESVADNSDVTSPATAIREVNSEHSEYSPYLYGDTLYFSSYRFENQKDKHIPKRNVIKIMTGIPDKDTLAIGTAEFNAPVNGEQQHSAHVAFNRNKTLLIYAVGKYTDASKIECRLFMRKRNGNVWGDPTPLPASINMAGYTTTEPSIGHSISDPGKEVLYFVSDRPGGKGGRDIWYSNILADSFSHPVNIGSLNTAGEDVTPFYHSKSGTLFYSTNGLRTIGGYDVYQARGMRTNWGAPDHMGIPINSGDNDVFYFQNDDSSIGLLASNREGSRNLSEEACCYDIYKVNLFKPKMEVVILDKTTKDSLRRSSVWLYALKPDGSPEDQGTKVEVIGAKWAFDLQPGKSYMLVGAKENYYNDTLRFQTPAKPWKDLMVKKLYLGQQTPVLVATIFDQLTREPIMGATLRFIDLGPVSVEPPRPVIKTDVHPLDNSYRYNLDYEHRYRVFASKNGYSTDSTDIISTIGLKTPSLIQRQLFLRNGLALQAHTINRANRDTMYQVNYELVDLTGGTAPKTYVNPLGNKYFITGLQPNREYRLIAKKEGFEPDTVMFNTNGLDPLSFQTIIKQLELKPPKVRLIVTVFDKDTKEAINGAASRFVNLGIIGSKSYRYLYRDESHPADNRYEYMLESDQYYRVSANKIGYTVDSTEIINPTEKAINGVIERKLYLQRGVSFKGYAVNKLTRDTLHDVTFRLIDLRSNEPEKVFVNPVPVKSYQTVLAFEKRYMLIAQKENWSSDTVRFNTVNLPKVEFQKIVRELQLLPLSLDAYLPIKLFFDNDEPDKRTLATTTQRQYQPTYVDYIRRKQEFQKNYTADMPEGKAKEDALVAIDNFFEKEVREGWNRLFAFSEALYKMMERGDSVVLTLRGFASPRAASNYNMALTSRRVSSVNNHFKLFDGSIYRKFQENGQLAIELEPRGETNPPGVSDVIGDQKRSVFSVEASRERRLEIIGVEVNKVKYDLRKTTAPRK